MKDPEIRFWSKVQKTEGCWLWSASCSVHGYGAFGWKIDGKWAMRNAHKAAWMFTYGRIPDGLFVCHKCDNRRCVRPDHLFLGTAQDNTDDMIKKGRGSFGDKHAVKLRSVDIVKIFEMVKSGIRNTDVARLFKVSEDMIGSIISRRRWRSVSVPNDVISYVIANRQAGTRNGRAKLTESQVLEIKKELQNPHYPNKDKDMAKRYGVGPKVIWDIKNGIRWRHINCPIPANAGSAVPSGLSQTGI